MKFRFDKFVEFVKKNKRSALKIEGPDASYDVGEYWIGGVELFDDDKPSYSRQAGCGYLECIYHPPVKPEPVYSDLVKAYVTPEDVMRLGDNPEICWTKAQLATELLKEGYPDRVYVWQILSAWSRTGKKKDEKYTWLLNRLASTVHGKSHCVTMAVTAAEATSVKGFLQKTSQTNADYNFSVDENYEIPFE